MTKLYLAVLCLLASLLLPCCVQAQGSHIYIRGSFSNIKDSEVIYLLINRERKERIAETRPVNGQFSFAVSTETPALFHLEFVNGAVPARFFAQDGDTIVITGNRRNLTTMQSSGSQLNSEYQEYQQLSKAAYDTFLAHNPGNEVFDPSAIALRFIKVNPASPVSAYLLYRSVAPAKISGKEMEALWSNFPATVKDGIYGKILAQRIGLVKKLDIGNQFIEVSLPDTSGQNTRLSDYTKRGYVLVDFWASWCVPCRGENRYLKSAYKKYRDKRFTIFSISLDNKKDAWTGAIRHDTLPWVQVSDLRYWDCQPAKEYGIISVPANVLISPKGEIIARNLRGDGLLKKLESIFETGVTAGNKGSR